MERMLVKCWNTHKFYFIVVVCIKLTSFCRTNLKLVNWNLNWTFLHSLSQKTKWIDDWCPHLLCLAVCVRRKGSEFGRPTVQKEKAERSCFDVKPEWNLSSYLYLYLCLRLRLRLDLGFELDCVKLKVKFSQ